MSYGLKNIIIYTYDENRSIKPKGHEVRKMSTSWAHIKGASTEEILMATSCASTTTFTSHYLLDLQKLFDGKFRFSLIFPGINPSN